MVAEPGGAAALAALVSRAYVPTPGERVAVVISSSDATARMDEERLRPEQGAKPPSEQRLGAPASAGHGTAGDQLRRGLAVARTDCRRAEADRASALS